jgi:hypothetical protein
MRPSSSGYAMTSSRTRAKLHNNRKGEVTSPF